MHSEDEFSAGSYGSAKRDGVRLLKGTFPVRIVVEGPTREEVELLTKQIDRQIALGTLGHLPIGGHKTRGAGWGHWQAKPWRIDDVHKARDWRPQAAAEQPEKTFRPSNGTDSAFLEAPASTEAWVRVKPERVEHETIQPNGALTLSKAAQWAQSKLGQGTALVAWWCEPSIDLNRNQPPLTFGHTWPLDSDVRVDEAAFYAERAVYRVARTSGGIRAVLIEEVDKDQANAKAVRVTFTPARLHNAQRFAAAQTGPGQVMLRVWADGDEIVGYTITEVRKP